MARTMGLVVAIAGLILGAAAGTGGQEPVVVEMRDFAFFPRDMIVTAGATVRWVNFDDAPHQIAMTARAPGSSGLIAPGNDYAFTFNQPGQFVYRCGVHPTMLGVVIVGASD